MYASKHLPVILLCTFILTCKGDSVTENLCPEENIMTTRLELEAMMRLLMKKAKAKYGTLEMISWKTGVSTKSLHRYEIGEVLPSLEVYAILCECVGCRCYSEKSGSDIFILYLVSMHRTGLSDALNFELRNDTIIAKAEISTNFKRR